ncbi:DNA translocase FtsK 4TM domain-containing protein [Bradyrhizobium semiaridum]|uniref:DNA translocase FtsK 4TM domain-containing protein n=1 Tax=Bradyrhizobium semiaridum TaxID=2821404 RepID=UPI0035D671AB
MPAIERVIPLVGHLPLSLREALVRRLRELAGLGLIALSGVVAAALMTWSVQDPSLSHATSRAIRNVVGYPGAIGADLLMQILGLGAIMLILPVSDRLAAPDRARRRDRRCAVPRAGGGIRPARVHLSRRAWLDPIRGDGGELRVRLRLGRQGAGRRTDADCG